MSDDDRRPTDEPNEPQAPGESQEQDRLEQFAEWKKRYEAEELDPRELFQQVSRIAGFMSYDMIDKLQWWEKETLKLSDDEIAERLPHMVSFLERLRSAYLHFTEVDF